jgi:arabinogalactan oligomer / maltooligosaccharide transport system permease protein
MSNFSQTLETLRTSQKFQKRLSLIVRFIIAVFLIFFAIFPVLWIISASFSGTQSLSTQTLIPAKASLVNYQRLFGMDPTYRFGDLVFQKWIWNSVKISGISTILSLAITTMAAYAFSRMRFKGRVTMLKGSC